MIILDSMESEVLISVNWTFFTRR